MATNYAKVLDIQHDETQHNGLYVMLSIKNTRYTHWILLRCVLLYWVSHFLFVMLGAVMLSVTFYFCGAECRYDKCLCAGYC